MTSSEDRHRENPCDTEARRKCNQILGYLGEVGSATLGTGRLRKRRGRLPNTRISSLRGHVECEFPAGIGLKRPTAASFNLRTHSARPRKHRLFSLPDVESPATSAQSNSTRSLMPDASQVPACSFLVTVRRPSPTHRAFPESPGTARDSGCRRPQSGWWWGW